MGLREQNVYQNTPEHVNNVFYNFFNLIWIIYTRHSCTYNIPLNFFDRFFSILKFIYLKLSHFSTFSERQAISNSCSKS